MKESSSAQSSPKHHSESIPPQSSPKVQHTHLPQQPSSKLQTVVGKPVGPNQSIIATTGVPPPPMTTKTQTVQPEKIEKPNIPSRPPSVSSSEPPAQKPPVLQQLSNTSQPGTPNTVRGPPPAIPPRKGNIAIRSDSVQIPSTREMRPLKRQISATSVPPVVTPQQPPAFVIPPRISAKGGLTRQGSLGSTTSNTSQKKP